MHKEKLTMVQSCNFTLLDPPDFPRRMDKNSYPLVVAYNGRDHYSPTKLTTYVQYYKWKLEKELAPILSAGLLVCEEMDRKFLTDAQANAVSEIEAKNLEHLPTLSTAVNAAHHAMVARVPGRGSRGPVFHDPGALKVPEPPAPPYNPPGGHPSTSTTGGPSSADQQPPPTQKKGKYVCDVCSVSKTRKPALEGHLWIAHGLGKPIRCEPCNKDFSQKSALTKHIKTIHQKIYKHKCPDCWWGSDDCHEYVTHRKRAHKKVLRKKTGERREWECGQCKKQFDGPNLLRKHKARGTCMAHKQHQCPTCLKMYITLENRDKHVQAFHTPGARTWVCSICSKVTHSLGAHLNHALWHHGLGVLARSRAIRLRHIQTQAMKDTSVNIAKKLPHVGKRKPRKPVAPKVPPSKVLKAIAATKSAPPKIIPWTSPRKKATKGKKK